LENLPEYAAPSVSLGTVPAYSTYEKGDAAGTSATVDLTGTVTVNSVVPDATITAVEFKRNAGTIDTPVALPGNAVYNYTDLTGVDGVTNTSYTFQVTDGQGNHSSVRNFTYVYPFFSGTVVNPGDIFDGMTRAQVLATNSPQSYVKGKSDTNVGYSIGGSEHTFLMYPASYGNLDEILDDSSFDVISSMIGGAAGQTINVTSMLDASSQLYKAYVLTTPTTGTFNFRYNF